ncbi:hypothetical protein ACQEU8_00515 [Streptomyces sp. CA-250714]|uniref:hypothetical protein n=1 Tax=Streptomyces sp. CA-250714 TaxID=3240060 RepID=UPI003D900B7D
MLYRIVHAEPELEGIPDELRELVTHCPVKASEDRPGLDGILWMCRTASGDTQLRRPGDWLPCAVSADISHRRGSARPVTDPAAHPG